MNKCKIIESGRLNKFEMLSIRGGVNDCTEEKDYKVTDGCQGKGTRYSICPSSYESCIQATYTSCGSQYNGPSGPAGLIPEFQPGLIP